MIPDSQDFDAFLEHADQYPDSISSAEFRGSSTSVYREQLNSRSEKLFSPESRGAVVIWEVYRRDEGFHAVQIRGSRAMKEHLFTPLRDGRPDPRSRFFFIQSPHSRERLDISASMMYQVLTYHHVMPPFLEHLLPYGRQQNKRDPYGAGFRGASRWHELDKGPTFQKLARSGMQLELCYTLMSPESADDLGLGWSVRQCSIYHSFDLSTERAVWMVIKGNSSMKETITSLIGRESKDSLDNKNELNRALQNALEVHLTVCKWSAENWAAYIQSLETLLQGTTRRTLSTRVEPIRSGSVISSQPLSPIPRQHQSHSTFNEKSGSQFALKRFASFSSKATTTFQEETRLPPTQIDAPEVTFKDLQSTHKVEEKANDAAMVLRFNAEVLARIEQEYDTALETSAHSYDTWEHSRSHIRRFKARLASLKADLDMHLTRANSLIHLIRERKNLLNDLIQYRNMQATQSSAFKMELLTKEMHEIAQKTQVETVSMRIITVVTLFFLPGTFISTLMSTPVVTFDDGDDGISDRNIGQGALQFYIAVSLPLMALTFASWYAVHWWERRKERRRRHFFLSKLEGKDTA